MLHLLLKAVDLLRHKGRLRRWNTAQAWGRRGEDLAHRYLQELGYKIVARNYRTRSGSAEVDIVAYYKTNLIFVEVKSRESEEYGPPDRAVDSEKREHIRRAAREYLRRAELPWSCARFDIVNVVFGAQNRIRHVPDAFSSVDRINSSAAD